MNHVHGQVPKHVAADAARSWEYLTRHKDFSMHAPEAVAAKLRDLATSGKQLDHAALDGLLGGTEAAAQQVSDFFKGAKAAPASADRKVPKSKQIPEKPVPITPVKAKAEGFLGHLNSQQRVGVGISALFAAFGAIGTLDAVSKIKKTEADGQTHVQATQVGLALLNGLVTAGMGYAAYHQFRGR